MRCAVPRLSACACCRSHDALADRPARDEEGRGSRGQPPEAEQERRGARVTPTAEATGKRRERRGKARRSGAEGGHADTRKSGQRRRRNEASQLLSAAAAP